MIRLGRRIVEELDLHRGVDTLAKWMSHYVAELIGQAEVEADAAKRQACRDKCCAVIERLWAIRDRLPRGAQPLGRLREPLQALQAMRADSAEFPPMARRYAGGLKNPWLVYASNSHVADRRTSWIAFLAGLLESELGVEKRWVDDAGDALSEDERKLVANLDQWTDEHLGLLRFADGAPITSLMPAERDKRLLAEIEKSLDEQFEAFEQLKEAVVKRGGTTA